MSKYRSHTCNELRNKDIGKKVFLSGWINKKRDHGNLLFIDLRDNYGITQCIIDKANPNFNKLEKMQLETVIKVDGKVVSRSEETINKEIESGEIEIAPLAFMRGRTLKNSFAILDEAQNATSTQIKMFLTRIGENSKLVVNGDPSQIDLPNKNQSGLIKSQNILKDIPEISVVNFDQNDVIRHPLVSKIVAAYQKNDNDKS